MIQIIVGHKGKGKTVHLINKANNAVKATKGNIIFLDKNLRHMYELDHKIRIIPVEEYKLESYKEFMGFMCGVISQDNDIDEIYIDGLLKLGQLTTDKAHIVIEKLENISEKYKINFTISISCEENELPDNAAKYVIMSL